MWDFYSTPVDVLYLILSICIVLLTLFIVIAIWRIIRILRDINTLTDRAKDTVDLVNHYLWQPIKILTQLIEKSKNKANETIKNAAKKVRKRKESNLS